MVSAMASAYEGLTEEERERVFMLAIGKDDYTSMDTNFCQGIAACADESGGPWWNALEAAQRDVVFYIKTDPINDDSWEFYCHYSMNTGRDEFDDTIQQMLSITAANATIDESIFGNEATIELEQPVATLVEDPSQNPVLLMSNTDPAVFSSSYRASSSVLSLIISVSILTWSMV